MIKVSVLYPHSPAATFDMGYYLETHMPMVQRKPGRVDVGARRTGQVGNERAGVDGDQRRSSRSFLRSSENETLPRSARNFS